MLYRCLVMFVTFIAIALLVHTPEASAGDINFRMVTDQANSIFTPQQQVVFYLVSKNQIEGKVKIAVRDMNDHIVHEEIVAIKSKKQSSRHKIQIPELPVGYYELDAALVADSGPTDQKARMASFGVAPLMSFEQAAAARTESRFGVKTWNHRKFPARESMSTSARLGLLWTRELFTKLDTLDGIPLNIIMKVETYPAEMYDEQRYGPRENYEKSRLHWQKSTVPKIKAYRAWMTEKIRLMPTDQRVFEIWNEPWGKFPAEDFVQISDVIQQVIHENRSDYVVGPNLGVPGYELDYFELGGMQGMNAIMLHPYSPPGPEYSQHGSIRQRLRFTKKFYQKQLGYLPDLYVTEFGWPTPPSGPFKRITERMQAQFIVRQALMMLAEDIKASVAHVLGQQEKDPTNREHWYGLMRVDGTPKPSLLAYAAIARVTQGAEFVGDLWFGPNIGAMLFEKNGTYTLALWTDQPSKAIRFNPHASRLERISMVGKTDDITPNTDGELDIKLTGDVVYLRGVGSELSTLCKPWTPDRWPSKHERTTRVILHGDSVPKIDGLLNDVAWKDATTIVLSNASVNANDASGIARVLWDKDYLYFAMDARDNDPYRNDRLPLEVYDGDSLELWFSPDPENEIKGVKRRTDFQLLFSPTSRSGKPVAIRVVKNNNQGKPIEDLKMRWKKTAHGATVEMAIPWSAFDSYKPAAGKVAAMEIRMNDTDKVHGRFKINPIDGNPSHKDASLWSFLRFERPAP